VRVLERVVERVRERTLDLGGVEFDRGRLGADLERDPCGFGAEAGERLPGELVGVPELAMRLGGSGFETREVEQLFDDAVETRRLAANRFGQAEPVLRLQRQARA